MGNVDLFEEELLMKTGFAFLVTLAALFWLQPLFLSLTLASYHSPTPAQMKPGKMRMGEKDMKMKPGKMKMKMEMTSEGIFEGVGEIIAVVPQKSQLVLGHEEIKGFMKAMPMGMGYSVKSADLLEKVKPGDPVKFKIDASIKKIIAIEVIEKR